MKLYLTIVFVVLYNCFVVIFGRYAPQYNRTVYVQHGSNLTYGPANNYYKGQHINSTFFYNNNTAVRPYNNNTRIVFGPYVPIQNSG